MINPGFSVDYPPGMCYNKSKKYPTFTGWKVEKLRETVLYWMVSRFFYN